MKPIIRFAQPDDLSQIIELCALHAEYEQSDYSATGKKERLGLHLFGDTPEFNCLVVEKENELIGYATYMKQYSTWDADFYIYMDCLFM